MGNIAWSKSYSASDNGTVLGGADIQNIQADITAVVNGALSDSNIASDAAIKESKLAFNTSTGHDHDGTDSKLISTSELGYRAGLTLYGDDDTNICVYPGTIEVGNTILTKTTVSGDLAIATSGTWLHGFADPFASGWIYVYVYDNSNVLGYKFSDEPPDLSDNDDNVAQIPFRYQKYGSTYYRCIGAVYSDADGDLCWGQASSEGRFVTNFDASSICVMGGKGTGADQTMVTLWTPTHVRLISSITDTAVIDGDNAELYETTREMLTTVYHAAALNMVHGVLAANEHEFEAITTAGSINAITPQSVSAAGSFTIDAMTDNAIWYAVAMSDMWR